MWRKYIAAPAANVFSYLAPADGPAEDPSPQPPPPAPIDGYQPNEEDAGEDGASDSEPPPPAAPSGYGPAPPADGAAPKRRKGKRKKAALHNGVTPKPPAPTAELAVNYVQATEPVTLTGHQKLAASAYFTEDASPPAAAPTKPTLSTPALPDFSAKLKATPTSAPVPPRSGASREGFNANWNERFQALLEGGEQDEQAKLKKYEKLSALWREFMHTAKSCGKIIISERHMPNDRRTIPAVALGGCAGGVKYIYHGILFKFAIDDHRLYGGSDHFAQKAAGHELKGLMRYFMQPGLHVPLMALVDYKGHRLVASSILPILPGDDGTIRYGSPDGGRTVYASDPELMERMEQAGRRLNLKGHMAGQKTGDRKFLYSPCDIEGHKVRQQPITVLVS